MDAETVWEYSLISGLPYSDGMMHTIIEIAQSLSNSGARPMAYISEDVPFSCDFQFVGFQSYKTHQILPIFYAIGVAFSAMHSECGGPVNDRWKVRRHFKEVWLNFLPFVGIIYTTPMIHIRNDCSCL